LASAGQPTSQQFWLDETAAQTTGGWGVFTAQIIKYRSGWGKSFGTIGYSGTSTSTAKSAVWHYPWTCSTASTTGVAGSLCDKLYTATANGSTATAGSNTANVVKLYVVVSLWSVGDTNAGTPANIEPFTSKNDFKLTFIPAAWDATIVTYTDLTAATQPAAASSLTGIAGAQALAAATAALAAAAALY
jgi:hypothetical protein